MTDALELTRALIACPSVTPADAGCQALMTARLAASGFSIETLQFGSVTNLWARRRSPNSPRALGTGATLFSNRPPSRSRTSTRAPVRPM